MKTVKYIVIVLVILLVLLIAGGSFYTVREDVPAARRGGEDILLLCPLAGEVLLLCRAPDGAFLLLSGVCPAGLPAVVFFNECSLGTKKHVRTWMRT